MKKFNFQAMMKWLNARHVRERAILLCGGLGVLGMVWLALVHDVLVLAKETEARNITIADSRILEEQNRQAEIQGTYTSDPNTFVLSRQRELRDEAENATNRLNQLYGDLISPQQMSQVLTTILHSETRLSLLSLENSPSEALISTAATPEADPGPGIQVFKHGFRMVFEGNFIETVYYLRSLEALDGNFFWENLNFRVTEYPNAEVSLDIYTLSTEQGWIGV
jgi:MSHA biogenesis protein MshJ